MNSPSPANSTKFISSPLFWLGIVFAFGLLALLLRLASSTNYQGNLITYTDAGAAYVAADPSTFPIQLYPQFDQNSVRMIARDPAIPQQQFISINPNTLQNTSAASTQSEQEAASTNPPAPPITCEGPEHTLLLDGHTVLRNVRWRIPNSNTYGCGTVIPHRKATGHFWFFGPENIELTCKALNGTALTGAYWVFCGALTDVEWWMDAINNANPNTRKQYYNAPGKMASFGDTSALLAGSNTSPTFSTLNCGETFQIPKGSIGSLATFVQDAQSDNIMASIKILEGDPYLQLAPQWTNPVPGNGADLLTAITFPNQPGNYLIGVEATDQMSLIPTLCTIGIQVR